MKLRTILHPTDFDEPSQWALRYAVDLAHDYKANLIVLHAVETLGPEKLTYGEAASARQPEAFRERLWQQIHQIRSPDPQIAMEYVLSEQDPVEAIVDLARTRRCDLIVIGTHGRKGWKRALEGSIAELVVREAPCPVLVVKNLQAEQAPTEIPQEMPLHPGFLSETGQ